MMNLVIAEGDDFNICSAQDLERFVPTSLGGEVVNYGQGEGQFTVLDTTWGVYANDQGLYYLQFEEGQCEWLKFQKIVLALITQIESEFGASAILLFEGTFERQQPPYNVQIPSER